MFQWQSENKEAGKETGPSEIQTLNNKLEDVFKRSRVGASKQGKHKWR